MSNKNLKSFDLSEIDPMGGYRLSAFTIAEILITIGIIGVIASMTISTLITNYQKSQTVAKLKKVYSTLQQATISAKQDYGEVNEWYYSNSFEFGQRYFKPYLRVIVDSQNERYYYTDLAGKKSSWMQPTLILADGTYIFFMLTVFDVKFHIGVDINGKEKPNKLGRDLFVFSYVDNGLNTYSQYQRNDKNRQYITGAYTSGQCNKNAQGGVLGPGSYCSTLIQVNGWEIKDDYPW